MHPSVHLPLSLLPTIIQSLDQSSYQPGFRRSNPTSKMECTHAEAQKYCQVGGWAGLTGL